MNFTDVKNFDSVTGGWINIPQTDRKICKPYMWLVITILNLYRTLKIQQFKRQEKTKPAIQLESR